MFEQFFFYKANEKCDVKMKRIYCLLEKALFIILKACSH